MKISNEFKNQTKFIIFSIILVLFNIFTILASHGLETKNIYVLSSIIMTIALGIVYYLIFRKLEKFSWEKVFLITIIPLGLWYMLVIPMGKISDEINHICRAWEISEGHIVTDIDENGRVGRKLPTELDYIVDEDLTSYEQYYQNLQIKKSGEQSFIIFPNTALYSFVCYVPQVIGISIREAMQPSVFCHSVFSKI